MEHGYKWNGLFIRKSYKYFAELRRRIFELIRFGLPAELKGSAQSTNYLRFENGAQIMLTVIESMDKAEFFQGQQFSEISIEEACQFPFIEQLIEMLKGCMRSAARPDDADVSDGQPRRPGPQPGQGQVHALRGEAGPDHDRRFWHEFRLHSQSCGRQQDFVRE
jgi:hypothetical protein